MIRVNRKEQFVEFIPTSQRDEDGQPVTDAAVFVYRKPRRRDYAEMVRVLKQGGDGDEMKFDLDSSFEVVSLVIKEVRNVEDEDGPFQFSRDDSGELTNLQELDLFEPRDIFELAMAIVTGSQLGVEQGGK